MDNIIGRSLEETKDLISKGADINFKLYSGENALFFSDYETTEWLIKNGIDLYCENKNGNNALFYSEGDCLNLLIESGLNVNHLNFKNENALFYVHDVESFDILMKNGIDINQVNKDGDNVLLNLLPIASDKEDLINRIVQSNIDINHANEKGYNALFIGGYQYAQLFIDNGIDIEHVDYDGNNIVLFVLKKFPFSNNYKMIELLINNGASIDSKNYEGETPILFINNNELMQLFIDKGVDYHQSAIIAKFIKDDNIDMVKWLLNKGVDIQTRTIKGYSLLALAESNEMIKFLIDSGIKCEEYDLRFCDQEMLDYYKNKSDD